jgi:hypothetical protein
VEQAGIRIVRDTYEKDGWTVTSVERQKVGYDLHCTNSTEEEHVEVKATQGTEVTFIITAGEMRNVVLDRRHLTVIVTEALTNAPNIHRYNKERFLAELKCEPIAFRAVMKDSSQ